MASSRAAGGGRRSCGRTPRGRRGSRREKYSTTRATFASGRRGGNERNAEGPRTSRREAREHGTERTHERQAVGGDARGASLRRRPGLPGGRRGADLVLQP